MRKVRYRPYLFLFAFALLPFFLPHSLSHQLRIATLSTVIPLGENFIPSSAYEEREGVTLAKVIYREPSTWSSFLWVNVGMQDNSENVIVVAKNSPVLLDDALIGVVEEVSNKRSRVRLITDSRLVPSVRVVRGSRVERELIRRIDLLLDALSLQTENNTEIQIIIESLVNLKEDLFGDDGDRYFAKGEVFGASLPIWRCRGQVLKGIGFNYDFADEKGPARELSTGRALHETVESVGEPLIKVGDHLVTTGLDGVFPPGLLVGFVSKIFPAEEGDTSYDLEAKIAAGNLDDIDVVRILPPFASK